MCRQSVAWLSRLDRVVGGRAGCAAGCPAGFHAAVPPAVCAHQGVRSLCSSGGRAQAVGTGRRAAADLRRSGGRSDREAYRDPLLQRAGALQIVTAQAEQAVIRFVRRDQFLPAPALHQPIPDVDHPDRRQGYAQQQDIQATGIGQLALFQIEAVAFPIAEGRRNSVPFAAPPPRLGVRRQVQRPVAGPVLRGRPIGEQVDRAKGPLLIQIDPLGDSSGRRAGVPGPAAVARRHRRCESAGPI